ncbi:hypothetical protein HYH03_013507 [Edaphochlamys debaryana]|uniref:Small RNA 2'-O-methyltransferase n=1 Tax=Edaphochlamys debaryana TaxID=47281 RepID=A0A835XQX5_9CHLO|nr:hypothetical protein HYH03_013507 [Edaphochlamys debaryana]|eukprot:KAG2487927.1 hypothetical protein HYH03_013507 [Edaphochlamys debaryana]
MADNPRALINQFFQRAKANPVYECVPAPEDGQVQRFLCTLTLPSVTIEGVSLEEACFQEEGRSKKAAQDAVAAVALRFLAEQPIYAAAKPYEASLLRTLATRVLSPQGLFRDPEVHGAAAAAVAFGGGWLPLAALPHSRLLRGWAKEFGGGSGAGGGAALLSSPAALVEVVRRELAAQAEADVAPAAAAAEAMEGVEAAAAAAAGSGAEAAGKTAARAEAEGAAAAAVAALGLALGPGGLCVRLSPEAAAAAAPPAASISHQQDPAVVAAGGVATVVVIPADSSLPLREQAVPAHGSLLSSVADLLACPSPHQVLQWGRVGHKASYAADPRLPTALGPGQDLLGPTAGAEEEAEAAGPRYSLAGHPLHSVAGAATATASAPAQPEPRPALSEAQGSIALPTAHAPTHPPAAGGPLPPGATPAGFASAAAAAAAAAAAGDDATAASAGGGGPAVAGGGLAGEVTSRRETEGAEVSSRRPEGGAAGAAGGGGGAAVLPPLALCFGSYRADSTVTLAVHRGAAAMDWEGDGQGEVRGPEHADPTPDVSPTGSTAHVHPHPHPHAHAHPHPHPHAHAHAHAHAHPPSGLGPQRRLSREGEASTHPSTHAAAATPGPAPATNGAPATGAGGGAATGRGEGRAGSGATPGGGGPGSAGPASPRGAYVQPPAVHPTLVTLPEPSLYSKLLLPPLALPGAGGGSGAAAEPPPPLSTTGLLPPPRGQPPLFSLAGEPLNVRATWLAGAPVYGDAVATTCRLSPSPHSKVHHVMKWRHYGARDLWRSATAATPASAYTRALHAPVLLRGLPGEYRGPASWQGPPPRRLLDAYAAAHAAAAPPALALDTPDVDAPGEGCATLAGTNFLGLPYSVTAGPAPLDLASQQAALCALWSLQDLDAACLRGGRSAEELAADPPPTRPAEPAEPPLDATLSALRRLSSSGAPATSAGATVSGGGETGAAIGGGGSGGAGGERGSGFGIQAEDEDAEVQGLGADVEVLAPGLAHARKPRDGALARISYTLSLPSAAALEAEPAGPLSDAAAAFADVTATGGPAAAFAGGAATDGGGASFGGGPVDGGGGFGPRAVGPGGAGVGVVLEQHGSLTLCVGGGRPGVPRAVDAALRRLHVGGRARVRLPVCLDGTNPLGCFGSSESDLVMDPDSALSLGSGSGSGFVTAVLDLALLHASLPLVEGRPGAAGGPALFTPPLGQQRMQAVAAVLRREGAATLVDLGCGEGRLIEGLVLGGTGADCGGPLRRAVGADVSGGALTAAARRLGKLTAAAVEVERLRLHGEESVPHPVEVSLYRGSALTRRPEGGGGAPWLGLRGCDAAALVEVVEHLDPGPLSLFGPCVLGALRPRTLVVTTPNWEYNAVLRGIEAAAATASAAGGGRRKGGASTGSSGAAGAGADAGAPAPKADTWPGPPGRDGLRLRCADHRFEWTRAEFEAWAGGLAEAHGYDVSFEGIGRANDEALALASPGYSGPQNPGAATQIAVFRRRGGVEEGPSTGAGGGEGAGQEEGEEGGAWERVWGPARVAAPREELEEAEAEAEARAGRDGAEDGLGGASTPAAHAEWDEAEAGAAGTSGAGGGGGAARAKRGSNDAGIGEGSPDQGQGAEGGHAPKRQALATATGGGPGPAAVVPPRPSVGPSGGGGLGVSAGGGSGGRAIEGGEAGAGSAVLAPLTAGPEAGGADASWVASAQQGADVDVDVF